MVWHVVVMKPRPELSAADRQALVDAFEKTLREISNVRDVHVGRRVLHGAGYESTSPDAADFLVVLGFDDVAGLQAYLQHPAHVELGARFAQTVSSAWVYDFEVGAGGLP